MEECNVMEEVIEEVRDDFDDCDLIGAPFPW